MYINRNSRNSWQKIEDGKSYCLNMDEGAKTCGVVILILSGEGRSTTVYQRLTLASLINHVKR
jgi:hypothetical protein